MSQSDLSKVIEFLQQELNLSDSSVQLALKQSRSDYLRSSSGIVVFPMHTFHLYLVAKVEVLVPK
jgi:hypothetical protein